MNLPTLPTTIYVLHNPGGQWEQGYTLIDSAYTEEQMQAYGQACRDAALLDAMNATLAFGKTGAVIAAVIGALK